MTRDGEMSTGAFLDALASGIADETEVGMVQQVLRQAERSGPLRVTGQTRGLLRSDVRPARRADARSRAGQRSPVGLRPRV